MDPIFTTPLVWATAHPFAAIAVASLVLGIEIGFFTALTASRWRLLVGHVYMGVVFAFPLIVFPISGRDVERLVTATAMSWVLYMAAVFVIVEIRRDRAAHAQRGV